MRIKKLFDRLMGSGQVCLLLVPLLIMASTVQATNYREDSFEYFASPIAGNSNYEDSVFLGLHIKEKKRILLINGEVITPIEYSDGDSFKLQETLYSVNLYSYDAYDNWNGEELPSTAQNMTEKINVFLGDFNGDGHTDQLLQSKGPGKTDKGLLVIYGSNTDLPLKIEMLKAGYGQYSAQYASINVSDVNGDGISDIDIELTDSTYSNLYKYAAVYGGANGFSAFQWKNKNGPTYTSLNYSGSAVKPNKGTIVPGGSSGSFRVNETGAASFTLPIYSPKGTAGMSTGLNLAYSSQSGNGPLGRGWSINAGAVISTCPANNYQNNDTTQLVYCLNGRKLIRLSGGTTTERVYATETTSISKVIGHFSSDTSEIATSFEILKKDGTKHEFTQIGESMWALEKVWNPTKSAYAQYDYLDVGTGIYKKTPSALARVSIKTKDDVVITQTDFNYETRPDVYSMYMDNSLKNLNKRINNITVKVGSEIVRSYYMAYDRSKLSGASRLNYIQECGLQGQCYEPIAFNWTQQDLLDGTEIKNNFGVTGIEKVVSGDFNKDGYADVALKKGDEMHIRMGNGDGSWTTPTNSVLDISGGNPDQAFTKLYAYDYNLDGYVDLVALTSYSSLKFVCDPGATSTADCEYKRNYGVRLTPYFSRAQELKTDFSFTAQNSLKFYPLNHSATSPPEMDQPYFTDVNGDGRMDVVIESPRLNQTKGNIAVYLYSKEVPDYGAVPEWGYGVYDISIARLIPNNIEHSSCTDEASYSIGMLDTNSKVTQVSASRFIDFDNDGFVDILFRGGIYCKDADSTTIQYVDSTKGWHVAYSPYGKRAGIFNQVLSDVDEEILAADFNGDGFVDIHTETGLLLNSGSNEFVNSSARLKINVSSINPPYGKTLDSFLPIEGNNDGLVDFAIVNGTRNSLYQLGYNEGNEINFYDFAANPNLTVADPIKSAINMDINGDGIQDIVVVSEAGRVSAHLVGISTASDQSPPDVIESIVASNGLKTQIEYGFGATDTEGLYTPDSDAQQPQGTWSIDAPTFDITGAVHLVKRVIDDAPSTEDINDTVSKRYAYVGGKLQAGGRGFLGFRKLIEVDETFNVKTVTEYAQEFPYQGMPLYTYTVTQADNFDATGIKDFVFNDVLEAASGSTTVAGFEALSNLDSEGQTTLENKTACKATINSGLDSDLTWLSCSRSILNVKEFATKGTNSKFNPVFPYVETAIEEFFHVKTFFDNGAKLTDRGGILKTVITKSEYAGNIDSFYGELTKQVVETSIVSSDGASKIAHTVTSEFGYEGNSVANWWLGRMTSQTVKSSRSAGSYIARTSDLSSFYTDGTTYKPSSGSSSGGMARIRPVTPESAFGGVDYPSLVDYDISHLTNDLSDAYNTEVTRNSIFTYNENGLLETSMVEPLSAELATKTIYGYDTWGNVTTVTKSSHENAPVDLQFFVKAESIYDSKGVYVTNTYEYEGGSRRATSTILESNRNSLGLVEEALGKNGISVFKVYDGFGRTVSQSSSVGAYTLTTYEDCQTDIHAPAGCKMVITETSNAAPTQKSFSDPLGQTLRASKIGLSGEWLHVDTQYDKVGRAIAVSNPHTGEADYWTKSAYDIFGRMLKTIYPDDATNAIEYDGLYVTSTDSLGLNKSSLSNALGQVVYVKEFKTASGAESVFKEVNYKYDIQGNRTHTIADGSTIITNFNLIGYPISTNDPAKGIWYSRSNAQGAVVAQLNAKGDYTSSNYDDLGRRTHRTTSLLTSGTISAPVLGAQLESTQWYYDTETNGMRKLDYVEGSFSYLGVNTTYKEDFEYNSLAQLKTKTTTIDGSSYRESWAYDSIGRVQMHYDASNGMSATPSRGTRSHYDSNHYVSGVSNIAGDYFYFTPLESDNWGNVTRFQNGNGVITHSVYDEETGRLSKLYAGKNTGNDELTDLAYFYDSVGNLDFKEDAQLGYKETISYDDTYRVESVAAQGTFENLNSSVDDYNLSITYHLNSSNIKTKSNYENNAQYNYGGSAACNGQTCAGSVLTSVGDLSFKYDANGNRTEEKRLDVIEREASYTSYEKPWSITKGDNYSKFAYGAGHQRIKQLSLTGGQSQTLHYVGGVEWKKEGNNWFYKRRIGGFAIEEQVQNESTGASEIEISYLHKDYQGSVVAITDANGIMKQRLSYDIYGARRNVLYSHATGYIKPTANLYDQIGAKTYSDDLIRQLALDVRGYTSHEHLDGVDLIHMNGRVYDPMAGLFLSADPNVPDPSNAYYMNRYTYTNNNPVTFTDPSGYWDLEKTVRSIGRDIDTGFRSLGDKYVQFNNSEEGQQAYALAIVMVTGSWGGGWAYAGGFASGYVQTGTFEGAVMGAIFASYSHGIGDFAAGMARNGVNPYAVAIAKASMHGAMGGIRARMNNESFSSGFKTAGLASIIGSSGAYVTAGFGTPVYRIASAAAVGGATSMLSGGKFGNGALTAAFVQAYNEENKHTKRRRAARGKWPHSNDRPQRRWSIQIGFKGEGEAFGGGGEVEQGWYIGINKNNEVKSGLYTTVSKSVISTNVGTAGGIQVGYGDIFTDDIAGSSLYSAGELDLPMTDLGYGMELLNTGHGGIIHNFSWTWGPDVSTTGIFSLESGGSYTETYKFW